MGASPHRPPHAYIDMYGEIVRALPFVCQGVEASPHRPLHAYIDMYGNQSGPAVPDCGAYAIRPYTSGRLFSSEWVGAYCIRPTRRPRKGDECGFWVVSQGDLLGPSGPYGARLWGVCCCTPRLRSLFFVRQGRGVLHTPHQTFPTRGQMQVPGYFAG